MSSASGINSNTSLNPQLLQLNIAAGGEISDIAMEDAKSAEQAKRLDEAQLISEMNVPNAMNADGDVIITDFNGPEIRSDYRPDLGRAEYFLQSDKFRDGQEAVRQNYYFTTNIFTSQTEVLLLLKDALRKARDAHTGVSTKLSDLNGRISQAMAKRMIEKGLETYAMSVAGHAVTAAVSFAGTAGGANNSANSRRELKDFHSATSRTDQARIEQQNALQTMQRQGKQETPEFHDLQSRLEKTTSQEKELNQAHELAKTKYDNRHGVHMAVQGIANAAGGSLGAGSSISDSQGEAEITLHRTTSEQGNDMKQKADQAIRDIENSINEALTTFRAMEEAANSLISGVARNIA